VSAISNLLHELRVFNDTFKEFVAAYRIANEVPYIESVDDMSEYPEPGLYHPAEKDEADYGAELEVIASLASKDPRYGWTIFDDPSEED
jgi:hypothetical protein